MTTLSDKNVKTRKPHDCWGCAIEFPAGTKMSVVVNVDMGKAMSTYWCDVCSAYQSEKIHYSDLEDGFGYGEIAGEYDDYQEFKTEYEKRRSLNYVEEVK